MLSLEDSYFPNMSLPNSIVIVISYSPRIDLFIDVSCASNEYSIPKLPIDVLIYPDRAHSLLFHILGLGFWMFRVFYCFSIINRTLSLIIMEFRGRQMPYLFLEISYQHPSYFIYILSVSIFQLCDINEIKSYVCCISMFMCIYVFYCIPA